MFHIQRYNDVRNRCKGIIISEKIAPGIEQRISPYQQIEPNTISKTPSVSGNEKFTNQFRLLEPHFRKKKPLKYHLHHSIANYNHDSDSEDELPGPASLLFSALITN